MGLFRLTYFVGNDPTEGAQWLSNNRYEIYGSAEAICDMYFHLSQLKKLKLSGAAESACPMFIEIYNKDGRNLTDIYHRHGTMGVISSECNTFK